MAILDDILESKRDHVSRQKLRTPIAALEACAGYDAPRRPFVERLKAMARPVALIAEVKKASPSKGVICERFDPARIATEYERGGAACISVLTDEQYFQGCDDDLVIARAATSLPALRKDFILDPYQLHESKALGADCVLLIVAAFDDPRFLTELYTLAIRLSLDVLVEVHNEDEMEIALNLRADLIGINNRDLGTFETDIATTERLAPLAPTGALVVSESAIRTHSDVCRVADAGAKAVLVGEGLISGSDIIGATRALMGR